MDLIKFSIKNPVTIIVSVLIVVMFGLLSLRSLPYQLTPNVTKPEITISTTWPGATPYEIEREIIEEQEDVIKSLNNLVKYESSSNDDYGEIKLTFKLGTDLRAALQDVSNKLNEVNSYPNNVDEPVIETATASPVIWMMLQTLDNNQRHIDEYRTYFEDEIKPIIKRVNGVSGTMDGGGREKQMQVKIDINKLASYNLTVNKVIDVLRSENIDVSAGIQNMGRRAYRIRTVHKFRSTTDIEKIVIVSNRDQRVTIGDIADVDFGYQTANSVAMFMGIDGIFLGVQPNSDVNTVKLTEEVEKVVNHLNDTVLKEKGLKLKWIYDQRNYIVGSVDLVQQNIIIGGVLAIFILILFLRAISPTAVVSIAIPISVIGTFIVLDLLGRSLNTISLAGISFAVGMLVDSAIVVLENIDRHRKEGMSVSQAAYVGAKEVWGALIASASTTMAVFIPIIFLEDEAGQLFKDIAIAVTSSVLFSLFVSIAVIPMLWKKFASISGKEPRGQSSLTKLGNSIVDKFMYVVHLSLKNTFTKVTTILILGISSITVIWVLFPKMDYLPQGNKNMIYNILIPPPGLSYKERYNMGAHLMNEIKPHFNKDVGDYPGINRAFFVSFGDFSLLGVTSMHESRARELIPLLRPIVNSIPSTYGVTIQSGVFESGVGEGNNIDIDISGESIDEIANVGTQLFMASQQILKGAQVRPVPSIELLYPEVRLIPKQDALKSLDMSSNDLGIIADVYMDGRNIGDFEQDGKKKIDLIVKAKDSQIRTPQDILNAQVVLPNSSLVPLSSLAKHENTTGISEIRHLDGKRTITLQVTPPEGMTIEEAMTILQGTINKLDSQGKISKNVKVNISGTADKLSQTIDMLGTNFILALVIIYLLMAALFGNFLYPIVIMFTVPLATAGGFIGLALTNKFIAAQPLDVLTMLGFIILVGIVVNNAILIVHQSLNLIRDHAYEHKKAVIEATKTRIRPIYMSSLTSVFGMLPLVLIPGPGSEFYRGLGSVITGGLALSTVFTIFITPALLMFFIKLEQTVKKKKKNI
ncbi:acriflavin resistance protein [Malaciobacter molluscorum LMG 25693]|uniref:Acriflavin resistance protein n=1 Tax=Malaciobacter molluscorum LMG 25693 TaxID=870501 RepID=A0A2G1DG30_9BACT|nr:efflux RND transporter permease subunit [Malaciobacter molluscorum]AXX91708.1 RND family efflux system, inner membrane transporter, AcrB family [Malaciobacter molluscorum LMG 25693]PHO17404.1 acriflavin resistance protein [Malaciobacter molluscorum LMG 25693]